MVSFDCVFSDPLTFDGTIPDDKQDSWNFYKETCTYTSSTTGNVYAPPTEISSSTDILLYGSITAGEVLVILLMFLLIVIELIKMMTRALDRVVTKKKYIGYTNAEVEIKDVL